MWRLVIQNQLKENQKMSMNLHLSASREITVNQTGKIEQQHVSFSLWQTPTLVTRAILGKTDQLAAYATWVMSISSDEIEKIYALDDWDETNPLGTRIVNHGADHITDLTAWIDSVKLAGYEIEFSEM
jgi:hypothetical protein